MSSARAVRRPPRRTPGRRRGRGGYTLLELMISMAILAILALVVERTLAATQEAERDLAGVRRVIERGQQLGYDIREVVSASRKLFQNDAVGQGYLAALDLYDPSPAIANLRLPLFDEVNPLGPDAPGDPRTGNVLLFVREADAAPAVANPATGKLRYVDTYRFVCIYIARTKRFLVEENPRRTAQDLVFWRSIAFPSYGQIQTISDPVERANVITDLYDRFGYDYCWDAGLPVNAAFFELDPAGTIGATPAAGFRVELDPELIERGRLVYADFQLARTNPDSYHRRAVLSVDDPAVWVPDGFEAKVIGTSGSRKVWIHLVIEAQTAKGRAAVHASTVIASTKDM